MGCDKDGGEIKMNRRRFFKSTLSLAALAVIDPLKLLPEKKHDQPKAIKTAEGPHHVITLNLPMSTPAQRYFIGAENSSVSLSMVDPPITLQPGQRVEIVATENGGWKVA